ncbi:uncharacterized protein B0H64DRAFT_388482 [Chaetomium fimeti]|uniref:Uncharacterized protein n=1 Tax=Chaetomium fimeti TaxID=1854472 RepID=A0AAE0HNH7_9PEZI|nr:hypothetical protein B0H64DRAFT_388482 [Chaetomium fimeti]
MTRAKILKKVQKSKRIQKSPKATNAGPTANLLAPPTPPRGRTTYRVPAAAASISSHTRWARSSSRASCWRTWRTWDSAASTRARATTQQRPCLASVNGQDRTSASTARAAATTSPGEWVVAAASATARPRTSKNDARKRLVSSPSWRKIRGEMAPQQKTDRAASMVENSVSSCRSGRSVWSEESGIGRERARGLRPWFKQAGH